MKKGTLSAAAVLLLLVSGVALGEERFGIPVYPGAKQDAVSAKACAAGQNACFRIPDDFSKVYAFYQKQANLEPPKLFKTMPPSMQKDMLEGPKKHFDFCKKGSGDMCGVGQLPSVRITSPWTVKHNISPAAKPDQYENKDVFLMITDK